MRLNLGIVDIRRAVTPRYRMRQRAIPMFRTPDSTNSASRADLDTVLRESDVVSLHLVLNRETRHMIGAEQFGLVKPAAIFINTARGFCVDEAALVETLERDRIDGAALHANRA